MPTEMLLQESQMRVGLYPGTFDPITLGHLDVIRRASALLDKLVIGVAINRDKGPLFGLEERVAMVEAETVKIAELTGIEIEAHPFENLLIDCARDVGATVIVRGLRAVAVPTGRVWRSGQRKPARDWPVGRDSGDQREP